MQDLFSSEGGIDSVKTDVASIGPLLLNNKLSQQRVLQELANVGGGSTVQSAYANALEHGKIGMRELSRHSGIPRKRLLRLINGEINMSPEDSIAIAGGIEKARPGYLAKMEKLADSLS